MSKGMDALAAAHLCGEHQHYKAGSNVFAKVSESNCRLKFAAMDKRFEGTDVTV